MPIPTKLMLHLIFTLILFNLTANTNSKYKLHFYFFLTFLKYLNFIYFVKYLFIIFFFLECDSVPDHPAWIQFNAVKFLLSLHWTCCTSSTHLFNLQAEEARKYGARVYCVGIKDFDEQQVREL